MADLVAGLRSELDTIILDTPPLRPVTDGVIAALLCDGAIVVVRNGRTSRAQLGRALQALRAAGVDVLGAVRNMVPLRRSGRSAYGATSRPAHGHRGRRTWATHGTGQPDTTGAE